MKRLVFLLAFTLCVSSVFSQSKTFELFRVSSLDLKHLVPSDQKDTTFTNLFYLISFDFDNLVVSFDNSSNTKCFISAIISKSIIKDDKGNSYDQTLYFCHDQNNSGCRLGIAICAATSDAIIMLEYGDIRVVLYTKLIKPAGVPVPSPKPDDNKDNNTNTTIS